MNDFFANLKGEFSKRHGLLCILGLLILSYFFFFYGLGDYRLIDIDETRYVNIARTMFKTGDYITPILNFEPFLEKPPLFYWLTCLSYKIFHDTGLYASRFPLALMATFGIFGTYFFAKNIMKSHLYAFLSAVILMSTFWYGFLSHVGILDSTFSVLCTLAFYSGVSTLFVEKEYQKKALWYLGYFLLALAVLQKGLIGIIIPGVSLLSVFLFLKRAKEIIKPSYLIPGILIFLIVAAPWHYLVYRANSELWFDDYILKHHLERFADVSDAIGRSRPFYFYIPVILGGFMPWSIFLILGFIEYIRKTNKEPIKALYMGKNQTGIMFIISMIWFFVIFLFFSISTTKLPTYILPAFPPLALMIGLMFHEFMTKDRFKKDMIMASYITFDMFFAAGITGVVVIALDIVWSEFLPLALCFIILPVFGYFAVKKYERNAIFNVVMSLCLVVTGLNSHYLFDFATSFGQPELEEMAHMVSQDNTSRLITYDCSKKYSLLNEYHKDKIVFLVDSPVNINYQMYALIDEANKNKQTLYVVVKNKRLDGFSYAKFFELVESGKKYTLYKKNPS